MKEKGGGPGLLEITTTPTLSPCAVAAQASHSSPHLQGPEGNGRKSTNLLRLIEPMNLVNKKDGFPLEKSLLVLSLFDDIPHVGCLGAGC